MPKVAKELSALEVGRLTMPGLWAVGVVTGLHLQVSATSTRSWILRAKVGGRRRDIGLGGYPGVPLVDARRLAREAREQIKGGVDPVENGRAQRSRLKSEGAKALTFAQAATACIAAKEPGWRNAKHAAQWRATLETYAYPVIGKLLIQHVERAHVVAVLEPIWSKKAETASRVRSRIEIVLDYAAQKLDLPQYLNPARYRNNLDKVLPQSARPKPEHHAAVGIDDAPKFMAKLRTMPGIAPRALEFLALTATRTSEVLGARWSEIDLDAGLWTIPAERMKAARAHTVPLSTAAVDLLRSLPRLHEGEGSDDADRVFASPRGGVLSINALRAVMLRMGHTEVPHGLRSTFRDWAAERSTAPHEVAEMALAHTVRDKTEAAYRRGDLLTKRAVLMQQWSDFLDQLREGAQVVPITGKAAA